MIVWDEEKKKQYKWVKISTYICWVACPIFYLIIAYYINLSLKEAGEYKFLFYMLFIIGIVEPAIYPIIEKFQISSYKKIRQTQITPAKLYTMVSYNKLAMVEVIYLLGMIVFFLSGDLSRTLYFYPVGIVWSFIYWPKEATFEKFLHKVERNEPYLSV